MRRPDSDADDYNYTEDDKDFGVSLIYHRTSVHETRGTSKLLFATE